MSGNPKLPWPARSYERNNVVTIAADDSIYQCSITFTPTLSSNPLNMTWKLIMVHEADGEDEAQEFEPTGFQRDARPPPLNFWME